MTGKTKYFHFFEFSLPSILSELGVLWAEDHIAWAFGGRALIQEKKNLSVGLYFI